MPGPRASRMMPSLPQAPRVIGVTPESVCGGPPLTETLFQFPVLSDEADELAVRGPKELVWQNGGSFGPWHCARVERIDRAEPQLTRCALQACEGIARREGEILPVWRERECSDRRFFRSGYLEPDTLLCRSRLAEVDECERYGARQRNGRDTPWQRSSTRRLASAIAPTRYLPPDPVRRP